MDKGKNITTASEQGAISPLSWGRHELYSISESYSQCHKNDILILLGQIQLFRDGMSSPLSPTTTTTLPGVGNYSEGVQSHTVNL